MNYWRCPGCARTRTDKGFWLHQKELCRCGWPIHGFTKVGPLDRERITQKRKELAELEGGQG